MSEQPSFKSVRPQRRTQPPAYLRDYEVQYHMQPTEPVITSSIQHSHCYSNEAAAGATSTPYSRADRQPDRQWSTTPHYESDGEEEHFLQEDESSFTSVRHRLEVQDLKRENMQLREAQMVLKEEIRQLQNLHKDMQNLMVQQQSALPAPQPQQIRATPVPFPRNVYRPLEAAAPSPVPYIPQPTPRRPQVPPRESSFKPGSDLYAFKSRPQPATAHNLPYSSPTGRPQSTEFPETSYRGPQPTIPCFIRRDPSEFARLKLALDNLLPDDATELFKYQVLLDHLKFEEACLIADSFLNSPRPYTDTMTALTDRFGRPHHLALTKIAAVMDAPDVQPGDLASFDRFALQIHALVGLLKTLGPEGNLELQCGSHVARLLTKPPPDLHASFRRHMPYQSGAVYTLLDLAEWLKFESWCQDCEDLNQRKEQRRRMVPPRSGSLVKSRLATVLHGSDQTPNTATQVPPASRQSNPVQRPEQSRVLCPYCDSTEQFLSQCITFQKFSKEDMIKWIKDNNRCWKCGRSHLVKNCTLKKPCRLCNGKHLQILHEVNDRSQTEGTCLVSSTNETLYLDRPEGSKHVLLKVIPVESEHKNQTLNTYAVLDDGSERTMLLPAAVQKLGLKGQTEDLALRTICQDVKKLIGASVSFRVRSISQPQRSYQIQNTFTSEHLSLAEHSYPITMLQQKYQHLKGIPLQPIHKARPLLLIGADHPHLITPIEPVRLGSPGGPAAIRTRLGCTLQGPTRFLQQQLHPQQCLHISVTPQMEELFRNVERLWQGDAIPHKNERLTVRSKQDQMAMDLLQDRTTRAMVDGVNRYATPLLRKADMPHLHATMDSVMPNLRSTERRLSKDPVKAATYNEEIKKLENYGYAVKLTMDSVITGGESWFIPHHMVQHNGKNHVVFNCSFEHKGQNLNHYLLAGPALGPSLLGVLLHFREHTAAVSGDIKGMFHQVRLLPEDKHLLRFIWRDLEPSNPPSIYEWQVLPLAQPAAPAVPSMLYSAMLWATRNLMTPSDQQLNGTST